MAISLFIARCFAWAVFAWAFCGVTIAVYLHAFNRPRVAWSGARRFFSLPIWKPVYVARSHKAPIIEALRNTGCTPKRRRCVIEYERPPREPAKALLQTGS